MFFHDNNIKSRRNMSPRLRSAVALGLLLARLAVSPAQAAEGIPAVLPPSKWITPLTFDTAPNGMAWPRPSSPAGCSFDHQINAQNDEEFFHAARQVVSPAAVPRNSQVTAQYDPNCQTLTFHWVRLWRGPTPSTASIRPDFNPPSPVWTPAPFSRLAKDAHSPAGRCPSGRHHRVRLSVTGGNPALDGRFVGKIPLQFADPVDHLYSRLVWPPPRLFYIKNHGTSVQPRTLNATNLVEYRLESPTSPGPALGTPDSFLLRPLLPGCS